MEGVPAARGYSGGFGVNLMAKDLSLAVDAASDAGASVEMGNLAKSLYQNIGKTDEFNDKDFSSVYKYISEKC